MVDVATHGHIVQRNSRSYVAYDSTDPITGKERRRWHPAGDDRPSAEPHGRPPRRRRPHRRSDTHGRVNLGSFLTEAWLPRKRAHVRSTTSHRYGWMIDRYIVPRLGDVALAALRTEHLDGLYEQLLIRGGRDGRALSAKTVRETHLVIRSALDLAVQRQLIDRKVALAVHSPKRRGGGAVVARVWSARALSTFLGLARTQRLYPALHLAAHTGMRRGEVVGLRWHDLDQSSRRLSVRWSVQCVAGKPTEFGTKTRTS